MRLRAFATVVAAICLVGACSNSDSAGESGGDTTTTGGDNGSAEPRGEFVPVDAPGVTDDEIRVEGVVAVTNPLGGSYASAVDGVEAYFAMVNSEGGVHGRQLVLAGVRDDRATNNTAEVKGLIDQNAAFAAMPIATLLFTGAQELVDAGVPTFGWTINPEWEGTPDNQKLNLFGQGGSFLCLGCEQPGPVWVAMEEGRSRIGSLAYNVPQSSECLEGWDRSFEVYGGAAGAEMVFRDASLTYGTTDFSAQVQRMKEEEVDMVITCMDTNAVVGLAQEMKKQDLDAIQVLPNAYDQELLDEFGDLFEGSYVLIGFAPLETSEDLKPEGLRLFEQWMEETGGDITENSLVGWLNADLFVKGLLAAGPDFDRQSVIDAINEMDDYTADGVLAGVDWATSGHYQRSDTACSSYLRIEDSRFVPILTDDIFLCFDVEDTELQAFYK